MKSPAFTLIESLIGVTLITLVLTAVTGLVLATLNGNQRNIHTVQATAYAEEVLEAMRFIRDSNALQNYAWNGGAALWRSDFDLGELDELELYLQGVNCPPCYQLSTQEEDGVVTSERGVDFVRRVIVTPVPEEAGLSVDQAVEVTARIEWDERGIDRRVELSTYLTDWH